MRVKLDLNGLSLGIKHELAKIKENWIELAFATFILVLVMISYLLTSNKENVKVFELEILLALHKPYGLGMFLLGYLWISHVSKDYMKEMTKLRYITLPINPLEKYLAKWMVSFAMFSVFYILFYFLLSFGIYQVMSSYEKLIELPPFFALGLGSSLYYFGIFHAIVLYFRLEFSTISRYIPGLVYVLIFVTRRMIDYSELNFYKLETYYLYTYFFLPLLALIALPLGYYAIKNKQLK